MTVCIASIIFASRFASAQPALIAKGSFAGTHADRSGLTEELSPGVSQNQLGGFSAIEYSGIGTVYFALPDRGPQDGAFPFETRVQTIDIRLPAGTSETVSTVSTLELKHLETRMLTDTEGIAFIGLASAFDKETSERSLRLDPEGLRCGNDGRLFVSDEYDPRVLQFDSTGRTTRSLAVPEYFKIRHPSASKADEARMNTSGRQPNRGLEGLAITPSGEKLFAIMQGPLIQDSAPLADGRRTGLNARILEFHISTGMIREFIYELDDERNGISEILAVNDHDFLVIERDANRGSDARFKKIVLARLDDATDIHNLPQLTENHLPAGTRPLGKSVFIDLLDARYGLRGNSFPEKVEGLTFGPGLSDGRRMLMVCVDNDFEMEQPSWIYAFAIDQASLPNFEWDY